MDTDTVDREMDVVVEVCAEEYSEVTVTVSVTCMSVTCTIDTERETETETETAVMVMKAWAGTELTVDGWSLRVSVVMILLKIVVEEVTVLDCGEPVVRVTVDAVGAVYVNIEVVTEIVVDGCRDPVVTVTVEAVGAVYVVKAVVVSSVVDIEGGTQLVVKVVVVVLTEELDVRVSVRVEVVEFETIGTDGCVSCANN